MDGASESSTRLFFKQAGTFDHLVLALSGGKGAGPIAELDLDDLRSGLEAKVLAQLTTLKAALPYVEQSITFVTAVSARAALVGTSGLAAINGALESMVRPLASELAPRRFNAVSPGVINTPWWDAMPREAKEEYFSQTAKKLPAGRVGSPEDVARAIIALAENSFITGTILEVDGGLHLAR